MCKTGIGVTFIPATKLCRECKFARPREYSDRLDWEWAFCAHPSSALVSADLITGGTRTDRLLCSLARVGGTPQNGRCGEDGRHWEPVETGQNEARGRSDADNEATAITTNKPTVSIPCDDSIQMTESLDSRRRLDPMGTSDTAHHDGMVRLQLWSDNPAENPYAIWMTPGQALTLIERLSRAAKLALHE